MELGIGVGTCGDIDKACIGFAAWFEIDYARFARLNADEIEAAKGCFENIKYEDIKDDSRLDWDYIRSIAVNDDIDCTLEEGFWEMCYGDEPDLQIISLMEALPEYPSLRDMVSEELEKFVHEFVLKTYITTEVTYEIDGIDVTDKVGHCVGKWDNFVFSDIAECVYIKLKKRFAEGIKEAEH